MNIDERVVARIRQAQQKLESEGNLPSSAELEGYRRNFRERFGPDRLAQLDGETLLEMMHMHGKDSLVYWLEFKDDEEFRNRTFGGIGGGTALKFGLFRRRETGAWVTGSAQNQREVSVEEAIRIARRHRDQLVLGTQLLKQLPAQATEAEYTELQGRMEAEAPDVAETAWGHKYFHLLFPEEIDDYHAPSYQRFYLITMLQTPPAGEGRYIAASRYAFLARELGMPMNQLTRALGEAMGRPYRYWRIGTRLGGKTSIWEMMREGECVAVGWELVRDLSDLSYDTASKETLRGLIQQHYPTTPQSVGNETQQLFNFVTVLREGDLVLPSDGARILGIGRVVGPYQYIAGSQAPHRRAARWLSLEEWSLPTREGLRRTVHEVRKNTDNLIEIERRVLYAPPPGLRPRSTRQVPEAAPPSLSGIAGRIQAVLERKGQVILYGPPGTGKTYWALRAASELAALAAFRRTFDQLAPEEATTVQGDSQGTEGLVRICTFHPAYGYEDFLEGYKPVSGREELTFDLFPGVFKRLCSDARSDAERNYYLIIDEINRGDIPRIFGELLTVLEKDKRTKGILLPLSGQRFEVPHNLYVIGTMNTADRSIALLDTALRRRFGFVELMPDSTLLRDTVIDGIPLGRWLDALNGRICQHLGRDARNLQIGHAYLLESGKPVTEFTKFARVLQDDILPLLQEYCYEDNDALERIVGKSLFDRGAQRIRHELFDPGREEELFSALLEPCPDLAATREAVSSEAKLPEEDTSEDDEDQA